MFFRALFCVCVLFLVGCDTGPKVSMVTGTIHLDGKPIANATITLSPVAGGTGKSAQGITNADGVYTVTDATSKNIGTGAVVGEYKVGILWFKPSIDTSRSSGSGEGSMNADKTAATKATGPDSLLPAAYQNPETSGLTLTVKAGTNKQDFELDSKFKAGKK
jgi:hypothetical protein